MDKNKKTNSTSDKEIKVIQNIAAELLQEDKFLASVAFVYTKKQNVILDIVEEFSSEEKKSEFIPQFSEKLLEEGANRVIFLRESVNWTPPKEMSKKEANEIKDKKLDSIYFQKQEIISMLDITKDYAVEYKIPFDREDPGTDKEKINIGKPKKTSIELEEFKPIQLSLKLVR